MNVFTDSKVSDGAGNTVVVWRVDVRTPKNHVPVTTLIKCGREEHAMRKLRTIRVSKLAHFRNYGEGLVRDISEGAASRIVTTDRRINDPTDLRVEQEFNDEVGKCAESIGESIRVTTKSIKTTSESRKRILFGRNCWIYSTAIEPKTDQQWDCLRDSLETEYDHVDYIYSPNQFAWSLGLMVVDQLGLLGSDQISTNSFGDKVTKIRTRGQIIAHGPVTYVADPFHTINSVRTDKERVLLPFFVKHCRFAGQREYRFVVLTEDEPTKSVIDLKISCALFGSLEERAPDHAVLHFTPMEDGKNLKLAEVPKVAGENHSEVVEGELLQSTENWFWPELLGKGDNPATPLSRKIDPSDYAANPRAAVTAAALSALRSKVAQVHNKRRMIAASAAWHAEPWISLLCKQFKDPIGGISITDDNILIVALKFPKGVTTKAKMSFGPSGAYVHTVKGAKDQLILHNSIFDVSAIPSGLGKTLSRLGLIRWSDHEDSVE